MNTSFTSLLDLPGPFSIVYADPPWSYYGDPNKDQAAGKHYSCMTDDQLAELPVRDILSPNAVVFLWATCPRLDSAIFLLREWGLYFRGVSFVWVKTRKDGGIINGQGIRPTLTKPTTEMVLAGTTTAKGRTLPIIDEGVPQVVLAPRGRHSAKPPEVRDLIVRLLGDIPRLELFARERVPGWEAWGNEVDTSVFL
jgi:N6-adenosine-specific RNA methylase IME4